MYYLFSNYSSVAIGFGFVLVLVLTACLGNFIISKIIKADDLRNNRESISIIFGAISLIYSLLIAFVMVAVWDDYEELNQTIESESDKLMEINILSMQLPDSLSKIINQHIYDYTSLVIKNEWHTNPEKRIENTQISNMRTDLYAMKSADATVSNTIESVNNDLSELGNIRQQRIRHNYSHVPQLVWFILIAGTFITVFCSWLFYIEKKAIHYLLIILLTFLIAMCLFLVYMLDHPFEGSTAVRPDSFYDVIKTVTSNL